MKNLLIVDDNKNNRMIIKFLLEDYAEENNITFSIKEVENGQEAVDLCEKEYFDIVFMDIMMPVLDGIEATKIIHAANKKMMIIAVSAVDDVERKKLIIQNGAEDYVAKPVNADIFKTRLSNYLHLIETRQHKKYNKDAINLFTKNIYKRRHVFYIEDEDALSEFWEYFLVEDRIKFDNISDLVRLLFTIFLMELENKKEGQIIVEENEESLYFTIRLNSARSVNEFDGLLESNNARFQYKTDDENVTFEFPKVLTLEPVSPVVQAAPAAEEKKEEVVISQENIVNEESLDVASSNWTDDLVVYDFLDDDDFENVGDYLKQLDSLFLVLSNSELSIEELSEVIYLLNLIGKIFCSYNETYTIGSNLQSLSDEIKENLSDFQSKSKDLAILCQAFTKDLLTWFEQVFHTGAPSVDFMDDTISSNTETIVSMLKAEESAESSEDLGDIFDF